MHWAEDSLLDRQKSEKAQRTAEGEEERRVKENIIKIQVNFKIIKQNKHNA